MVEPELTSSMLPLKHRAIVIPALNEAKKIARVVENVRAYGQVFVVDDGSTDSTGELASASGATVVRHDTPRGYDGALSSGFDAAFSAGAKAAITIDADGQLPADEVPVFFGKLEEGYDLVVGERPSLPRVSEWLFARLMRMSGSVVRDPFCGLKAYRLSFYAEHGHFDTYQSIGTDLMIFVLLSQGRVFSLPISVEPREGASRMGSLLHAEWKILKAVWRGIHRLWFNRARPPSHDKGCD
ncbi:glycosyltransferase family 2 protein [Parasphingorhabdus sp.]|uniref:glycosyltransferase family 2 protein n=1 Tax=Parasphingorhabdus sp. TaxID=2709688 RepID=UPI003266B6A7